MGIFVFQVAVTCCNPKTPKSCKPQVLNFGFWGSRFGVSGLAGVSKRRLAASEAPLQVRQRKAAVASAVVVVVVVAG